jgi:hypothetical protein
MVISAPKIGIFHYSSSTLRRAQQALCSAPFRLALYRAMIAESVPLPLIADRSGIDLGYTHRVLSESRVEGHLLWLIQVGLLRREVDGQGITDSFRLTPIGRQLVEQWRELSDLPQPSVRDRLVNGLRRWLKLPI